MQTQALVTAELIGRYLHGSLEEYKAVKQEYKGFSDAELLLLHYAAEAVDDGRGVWIVQDDEI